jgi:hypothetical protein
MVIMKMTAAILVAFASTGIAQSQNIDCRVAMPKSGLVGVSAYINSKNDAYLVMRFTDPRFDDTTEVYRLQGCSKIGSGISSKSTFDETLTKNGYERYSLNPGDRREFVNSIYGFIGLSVTQDAVSAKLEINSQDVVDALGQLRDIVALRVDIDAQVLKKLSGLGLLSRVPIQEFSTAPTSTLSASVLADRYLNRDRALPEFSEGNLKPIFDRYSANIFTTVSAAVSARSGIGRELDKAYARRVGDAGGARVTEALALRPLLNAVGHDSAESAVTLIDAVAKGGTFEDGVDMIAALRGSESASDSAVSLLTQRAISDVYRRHIAKAPRNVNARDGFVALHSAGFRSVQIERDCAATIREAGVFADAVSIYDKTRVHAVVAELQSLATSPADRLRLEQIAVEKTTSPGRLFEASVSGVDYAMSSDTGRSFWLGNPSWTAAVRIRGNVRVKRASQTPFPLELGRYRVVVEISAQIPRSGSSANDTGIVKANATVEISPGAAESSMPFELPEVVVASLRQTGWLSAGYSALSASDDGVLRYRIARVEAIK